MRLFRLIGALIWALPVYFLWNYLAPIYLPELPAQYLNVPFWHIAGIFVLLKIVSMMIFPRHRHFHHHRGWGCHFRKFRHHGRHKHFSQTYYHQ